MISSTSFKDLLASALLTCKGAIITSSCILTMRQRLRPPQALFHFKLLPFGLTDAPASFQCAFGRLPWCQIAFEDGKLALTSPPILAMPNLDEPFEMWPVASAFAKCALLPQHSGPRALESRELHEAQLNYHPGETDLMAIIHAITIWRCYLQGNSDVTDCTDLYPLSGFRLSQVCLPSNCSG